VDEWPQTCVIDSSTMAAQSVSSSGCRKQGRSESESFLQGEHTVQSQDEGTGRDSDGGAQEAPRSP
jgi:hypothetical protein